MLRKGSWQEYNLKNHGFLYFGTSVLGLCVPVECSSLDVDLLASEFTRNKELPLKFEVSCDSKDDRKTHATSALVSLCILIGLIAISLISTVLINFTNIAINKERRWQAFDMMANTKAIFQTSSNPGAQRLHFFGFARVLYLYGCVWGHIFLIASMASPSLYSEF